MAPPSITILIVDDDEAQLNLLGACLRRAGYRVLTSSNPVRALELVQSEDVKLVITDFLMPHVDGISFAEQLHQLPNNKDVPVILVTAFGTEELTDKGLRRGVALTLSKPVELQKLVDLVGFATH